MQTISPANLKERMDSGEHLNIVDVREPDEHAASNIGGQSVPLGKIMSMQADELDDLKDEEIICYCRSGKRSMQACLMLETIGFTNVKSLEGGITAYLDAYPS